MPGNVLVKRAATKRALAFVLGAAAASVPCFVDAQSWPTRPVRIISTAPPGGATDLLARILAEEYSKFFEHPFVVETRVGANGNVGVDQVLKAPPDGYMMFVAALGPFSSNQVLYDSTPFNPATDIAPISLLAFTPLVLVAHSAVPAKNLKELTEWMRAQGGRVNYASQATGSTGHLAMELFKTKTGVEATHVPFKGSADASLALLAGTVQLSFVNLSTTLPQILKGQLRAIGVGELKRIADARDIPTLHEQGLTGFEATPWQGLGTRTGVPREIIRRLADRATVALSQPEAARRMANVGIEPRVMPPDEFAAYIRSETIKWTEVIKRSGAKAQ